MISATDILKKKGVEQKEMDMNAFNEVVENFFMTHDAKSTILIIPKRFIEMETPPDGDFIDCLDETIWKRKASDPHDEFDFFDYMCRQRKGLIRPILYVNEPFAGNAAGWLRDFCGFTVKSRMRNKRKEYIVSLPV